MRTVLGLSVTPHGIAWALVEGGTTDATPLDDDAFDVEIADQLTARAAAAARSARAIAASSGQDVAAIGVCAVGPVADDAGDDCLTRLLDRLAADGFDDVRVVPEPSGTTGPDDLGAEEWLHAARSAALAVATNAVARAPRPVAVRAPAPRRYTAARAAAAAAAAIAAGLLTVGSQYVEPVQVPVADDGDITAAAEPQLVTVAAPREATRSVARPEEELVAERAARAPLAEPAEQPAESVETVQPAVTVQSVAAVETAAPQAVPVVRATVPTAVAIPAGGAPVQHIPAPVTGPIVGPPAVEPHLAADPAPGPASVPPSASAPVPAVPAPAPEPAPAGLWFLGAMP
ncbi:hypothetical protein [Mycobacterium sp. 48b]|uniref:hypothetical protein n=1 Tax=Mycobacterium sp. 48b TaxID=3400426 RepID=UPI003AAE9C2C